MSKKKIAVALAALLLTTFTVCVWFGLGSHASGETGYRRYLRAMRVGGGLRSASNHLPRPLAERVDRVADRILVGVHEKESFLRASGYLTNVSITLTGASSGLLKAPSVDELSLRLHASVPDNPFLPASLVAASNRIWVEVSCRTQDVVHVQRALASY
jgi:hypothetical protein